MHSITLILPLAWRKWKIIRNRALYPAIPEYLSIIRHFQRIETRSIILSRLRLFIKKAHAGVSTTSSHLRAPSIYASEYINRSAELQPKKGDPFFKTARARVALRVLPRMRARARPCRFIFSPGDPFFFNFQAFSLRRSVARALYYPAGRIVRRARARALRLPFTPLPRMRNRLSTRG